MSDARVRELEELVDGITRGLDDLRARLGAFAESGGQEPQRATDGGVTAEATLRAGLTTLTVDPDWAETQDLDVVGRSIVAAVNAAESACREQVWTSFADLRIGGFSVADVAADPEQFLTDQHPKENAS